MLCSAGVAAGDLAVLWVYAWATAAVPFLRKAGVLAKRAREFLHGCILSC